MKHGNTVIEKPYRISAVLFDFDGTLTKPDALDFSVIKKILGCPNEIPALEFVESIPDPQKRAEAFNELNRFESRAAANSEPNPGAEDLIRTIHSMDLPMGLITRNSMDSVREALKNFNGIGLNDFDVVITRNDPVRPKPNPESILLAARKLNVEPRHILMVGDFVFDIDAGRRAGTLTALLDVNPRVDKSRLKCDIILSCLADIEAVLQMGSPLPQGKLPNEMLEQILNGFSFEDPALLITAGVGEDIAAADISREEVLVLKSDPITFATDAIGHYAVLVNANDITTCGADPRWLLTTLLFPCGSTGSEIQHIMHGLNHIASKYRITLCGGHTEITDAVTRPVVVGSLAGTVHKNRLIDKKSMKTGDLLLITKSVAVEGTAIIAREMEHKLLSIGFSNADVCSCKQFLDHISIMEEARIARDIGGVTAMHDVTEGGLATAVTELSIAGKHRIRIDMNCIPIFPQTQRICDAFNISPLGLIGSGSLLICCNPDTKDDILAGIRKAGIDAVCIGEVLENGEGVVAVEGLKQAAWPRFKVDELARLFNPNIS
ncbi:HAD-IA family hydrolase [Thermodesulfobacteriota bacterium]